MDCQGRWEIPQWNIRCRKTHAIHCISYSPQKEWVSTLLPKERKDAHCPCKPSPQLILLPFLHTASHTTRSHSWNFCILLLYPWKTWVNHQGCSCTDSWCLHFKMPSILPSSTIRYTQLCYQKQSGKHEWLLALNRRRCPRSSLNGGKSNMEKRRRKNI